MNHTEQIPTNEDKYNSPEWHYAQPPTIYDLVRDNLLMRGLRLIVHMIYHPVIRCYYHLRVVGKENVLNNKPCIISPNHSSHLDTIAIFSSLPLSWVNNTHSLAAKDYFFENTFMELIARLLANGIPIDRTGSDKTGLLLCAKKQQEGKNIIIFPEGTRTTIGEIGPFKRGVVIFSQENKIPVIPAFIKGASESLPKSGYIPHRKNITVVFGKAICCWKEELIHLNDWEAAKYIENCVRLLQQKLNDVE